MGFGTYRIAEQRRLRRARTNAQTRQSIHCSHIQSMDVDETQAEMYTPSPTEYARNGVVVFFNFAHYICDKDKISMCWLTSLTVSDKIINFSTKSEG